MQCTRVALAEASVSVYCMAEPDGSVATSAQGMLSAAFISAVLANKLPGPGCVYLAQTLKFKAPVRIGDTVRATVSVREVNVARRRCVLDAVCTVAGKTVIEGESTMYCTSGSSAAA